MMLSNASDTDSDSPVAALVQDIKRYTIGLPRKQVPFLLFEQGIWSLAVYRFGRWTRSLRLPVVSQLSRATAFFLFKLAEIVTGISLPPSAKIGAGFYIGHFGPVILHGDVVIGRDCSVGPCVVIGTRGRGRAGAPVLGNGVYVGVGAKVLGAIKVGDSVNIGANAVVLTDVPDGSTVVGVPGRLIGRTPEHGDTPSSSSCRGPSS